MEEDIDKLEDFLEYNAFLKDALISDNIRELAVYMTKNEYKAIEHLIERNTELEKENQKLKCSIEKANKIIDEYANEIEDDTKK